VGGVSVVRQRGAQMGARVQVRAGDPEHGATGQGAGEAANPGTDGDTAGGRPGGAGRR
jgi:hypothetical protein